VDEGRDPWSGGDDKAVSEPGRTEPTDTASVDASDPATAPGRPGPPWLALIGIGAFAVIVLLLLAIFLLRPGDDPIAEASPSPTGTSAASSSPIVAANPSGRAEPTAGPTPSAPSAPTTVPESWSEAAVFSELGTRYVLGDLVAWSDGLVAVGTRYEDESRNVFGPPPQHTGQVWRSTDGTDWSDATPVGTFADVELLHLFEVADGALIAIGQVYNELDPVSAAWETLDGRTWTSVELAGIPDNAFVLQVASGARGHVASTYVGAEAHPLYSADGRNWEATLAEMDGIHSVAAGDEGFVASTFDVSVTAPQVVASSDGVEWFDATEPDGDAFLPAPRGRDWLATATTFAASTVSVSTWGSTNGLDWSRLGDMALVEADPTGVQCAEAPGSLHGLSTMTVAGTVMAGICGEGAIITAGGSYMSADGAEWMRLPFGDRAYAAGAVILGDRVVIGTDSRTGQAESFGVTFWISGAP